MNIATAWLVALALYCAAAFSSLVAVTRWSCSEERRRELAVRRLKKQAHR